MTISCETWSLSWNVLLKLITLFQWHEYLTIVSLVVLSFIKIVSCNCFTVIRTVSIKRFVSFFFHVVLNVQVTQTTFTSVAQSKVPVIHVICAFNSHYQKLIRMYLHCYSFIIYCYYYFHLIHETSQSYKNTINTYLHVLKIICLYRNYLCNTEKLWWNRNTNYFYLLEQLHLWE